MTNSTQFIAHYNIDAKLTGQRLDQALAQLCPSYSRALLQRWIRSGYIKVNSSTQTKTRKIVKLGDHIEINAQIVINEQWEPQPIALDIAYEDEAIIVINKPAGLTVHPGAGQPDQTLLNGLLHYDPSLGSVPRAGIVHRLDKNTSGLLVVARDLATHHQLVNLIKARLMHREYVAICKGLPTTGATIDAPIGRHPQHRTQMAVVHNGLPARTHFRITERYRAHTLLQIQLETGRTHQIRVHFMHIHYPLVGDPQYGQHITIPTTLSLPLQKALQAFHRQALHAITLTLPHPKTGENMSWSAPITQDMDNLIQLMRQDYDKATS